MNAAQRVQRRLKSGPHVRKLPNVLSILEAVGRLTVEADRARTAMHKEQLDPEDVYLGLLFTVSASLRNPLVSSRWERRTK